MNKNIIYTLGYTLFQKGNKIDTKLMFQTLKEFGVGFLVDVRTVPYSKQYPQSNAENLKCEGKKYGITYIHMPEIGAKVNDAQDVFSKASDIFFENIFPIPKSNRPEHIELQADNEIVDFNKFRNDEYFLDGLKRIETAYNKNYVLALMCSEKKPLDCHRYFLISKAIEQRLGDKFEIKHIQLIDNGEIGLITNQELTEQLKDLVCKKFDLDSSQWFNPIDNYFGTDSNERLLDFCDRYWNVIHGWKRQESEDNNYDYYY